jgi:hypothetical protein
VITNVSISCGPTGIFAGGAPTIPPGANASAPPLIARIIGSNDSRIDLKFGEPKMEPVFISLYDLILINFNIIDVKIRYLTELDFYMIIRIRDYIPL